jgi:hypothetical protein
MTGPAGAATELAQALDALAEVAQRAGVPADRARSEGAAFAAAIAESAPAAAQEWASGLGSDLQGFFDAAVSARRWRDAPTSTLEALLQAGSGLAGDYARALTEVAAGACALGEPTIRVVANASVAAAAQLRAAGVNGSPTGPASLLQPPDAAPGWAPGAPLPTPSELGHIVPTLNWPDLPQPGGGAPGADGGAPGADGGGQPDGGVPAAAPTDPAKPAQPAVPEPPAKTLAELLAELDGLIGLAKVKAEVHRQAQVLRIEQLRADAGLKSPTLTRHLVFVGNPGTGKTTVARLVSGIYRALGLLSKGQLVEVDRSELVAGYLGQTATKTAEAVARAIGGVLFVDEAYSLVGDQYGTEAIDTLVKEMEDHRDDLVVIVAGYPAPMAGFISANPGLASRFRTTITFEDYSDGELAGIFERLATEADYRPTPECLERFRNLLAGTPREEGFGNGRFARNVLEAAVGHQAWRLRDVAEPTADQLRDLLPEDLEDPDSPTEAVDWPPAPAGPTNDQPADDPPAHDEPAHDEPAQDQAGGDEMADHPSDPSPTEEQA